MTMAYSIKTGLKTNLPTPTKDIMSRPGSLRTTKTFPRHQVHEDVDPLMARVQRSSTSPAPAMTEKSPSSTPSPVSEPDQSDAFESQEATEGPPEPPRTSVDLDDIPIELISMTDNFIASLSARVHPMPPNIDKVSCLFQDYYNTASQHIQTHVSSLSTRHARNSSPRPAAISRPSAASLFKSRAVSLSGKDKNRSSERDHNEGPQQQMLTTDELAERKRQRKALEHKKVMLEEAVERRLCEGMYDRIYRHRSTQDEASDDKLRSRTAALAVVGIGPTELGIDLGTADDASAGAAVKRLEEVNESLGQARKDLIAMNEKRYPLGKLNHLKAAHKSIVDTLSRFHPSSSADEILPTLIYTLITMPPESLNVISDSLFIQRFRWEHKMEGDAAYSLTNLQAAVQFLETVDLASLRSDETPAGPKTDSFPGTPKLETFPPAYTASLSVPRDDMITSSNPSPTSTPTSNSVTTTVRRRGVSDLIQTPAQAIGNASDSFFNTADQSIKNIGTSLGESYKFLVGKLRDTSTTGGEVVFPRTLDDARKLVGTPPPEDDVSVDGSVSAAGADGGHDSPVRDSPVRNPNRLSTPSSSRRDRSTDSIRSARSAASSRKTNIDENTKDAPPAPGSSSGSGSGGNNPTAAAASLSTSSPAATTTTSNPALVDHMRNLGNSLNPMNRFANISVMRFGRTNSAAATSRPASAPTPAKEMVAKDVEGGDLSTAFPDIAAVLPPKETPQIQPPIQKFLDLENPSDLRLSEVLELLRDYRRLAGVLKDLDAFKS